MKFLVIGLGSMGKRRIRNLLANNVPLNDIAGFDIRAERREEAEKKYGVRTHENFESAVEKEKPDALIISTPPHEHHRYFLFAASKKISFFCEVTTTDEGYTALFSKIDNSFVAAPSCTFRYLPAIRRLKEIVQAGIIGKTLTYTYHLGQYLPDWHPWEDYRTVYFSQKETGACREMLPYELIWLTDIVGAGVKKIVGFTEHVSELDMSADDVYAAAVQFENRVTGTMLIELLARSPKRTLRLMGSEGILEWDWKTKLIRLFTTEKKEWEEIPLMVGHAEAGYINTEDMYEEEMAHFLAALRGEKPYPYTFSENQKILRALYNLESRTHPDTISSS